MQKILVLPYQPEWKDAYTQEASKLAQILSGIYLDIHHIGSTAIPGIYAKPVIDILVEVSDINLVNSYNTGLAAFGYEPKGEYGIAGRRYFQKGGERRTHNMHVYQQGHLEAMRLLHFRDYLKAHPLEAQIYSELKQTLSKQFSDMDSYIKGKADFVARIDKEAKRFFKNV